MTDIKRRTLLQSAGAAAFLAASAGVLPLFGTDGAQQDPAVCKSPDLSEQDKKLIVSNWPAYIDPRNKPTSTMAEFQQQTGISVSYTADVNDNAEFFAKVRNQMSTCQSVKRDMFVLTDWMAARMIALGWIQQFTPGSVKTMQENILPSLAHPAWDKNREYSATWQSGLTGIAYNAKETGEIKSFEELVSRPDLKGKITLLTEMRDTMAFMLFVVGADPANFTPAQWDSAIERLRKAVGDGQVRSFTGNDYIQDLTAGNIVACEAWSGDVIGVQADNPDIKFVIPEEGVMLWSDNMLVPNLATHQANAEKWIDYYYDPVVAAKLAGWVNYICPVKGAQQAMEKVDPSLVDNELIFPSEDTLAKTSLFMALGETQMQIYEGEWSDVTGA
ncbi:MAG: polyamine ABC transporter substrate-binding protein [Nocardioidaceae bacterium]